MQGNLIFTKSRGCIWMALIQGNRAVELRVEPEMREDTSLVGNIYIGKVRKVQKNIEAAFIEIENKRQCYYSIAENPSPLYTKKGNSVHMAEGDELLVQVIRDGIKTKLPAVKSEISFTGNYLVLTSGKKFLGFSGKLQTEQRQRIRTFMEKRLSADYGFIVRTNAADASEEIILKEADVLADKFKMIKQTAAYRTCYSKMNEQTPLYVEMLRDVYRTEYDRIVTDVPEICEAFQAHFQSQQTTEKKICLYEDPLLSLSKLYSLEKTFQDVLQPRVWLKSGGYLVIEPTEALTVIDVNTGKYDVGKKKQDTILKINKEAAKESARQIHLRNLSGIILIDFINMDNKEDEHALMEFLDQELKKDAIRTRLIDMTELGLVEITRKKVRKSLKQQINGIFCENNS